MAVGDKAKIREIMKLGDLHAIVMPAINRWAMTNPERTWPDKVTTRIAEEMFKPVAIRSGRFSPSSAGQCKRRQVFAFLGMPVSNSYTSPDLSAIFQAGKFTHLRFQGNGLAAGIFTDIEHKVSWNEYYQSGSMDACGVVPDDHPRVEWRGLTFGFELKGYISFKYNRSSGSPTQNMPQVKRYDTLSGFDLTVVIWENKDTLATQEWVYDSKSLAGWESADTDEMEELKNAVDYGSLPAPLPGYERGIPAECKECPYSGAGGVCRTTNAWPTP